MGSPIRARTQWLNEGEKPSKFFCSLEKYNYTEKTIKTIQLQDGQCITDQKEILEEIKNFYSSLFSKKKTEDQNLETLFKKKHIRKLTSSESRILEGDVNAWWN